MGPPGTVRSLLGAQLGRPAGRPRNAQAKAGLEARSPPLPQLGVGRPLETGHARQALSHDPTRQRARAARSRLFEGPATALGQCDTDSCYLLELGTSCSVWN